MADEIPLGPSRRRLSYGGVPYDGGPIEYPFQLTETTFLADWPWHLAEGLVKVNAKFRPDKVELWTILRGRGPIDPQLHGEAGYE